jgi:predicted GH43/DUF377 family glycosyl hydrolase
MNQQTSRDVIHRWPSNPLITPMDLPFQCADVHNAGVVRTNGNILLLVTVEALEGYCSLYPARSRDGRRFVVDEKPFLRPAASGPWARYESQGVRDARITPVDGTYYITYLAESECGFRVGLARTTDFQSAERVALLGEPDTKSGALFPRRIGDRYALLDRPGAGASIWISYSHDLEFWGHSTVVLTPRGGYWDAHRVGAAGPPIEIDEGWLLLYYGAKDTSAGPLYRLGAALLDKEDPSQVIARSNIPILSPRERYERIGDVGNLIFSCGAILEDDGVLKLYYGGADSCICLGTATVEEILQVCHESKGGF